MSGINEIDLVDPQSAASVEQTERTAESADNKL